MPVSRVARRAAPILLLASCGAGRGRTPTRIARPADALATTPIPVRYDEHRWVLRPVTTAGDTLDIYTDTGGEPVFIAHDAFPRGGVPFTFVDTTARGDSVFTAPWPPFRADAAIPAPLGGASPGRFRSTTRAAFTAGYAPRPPHPGRDGLIGSDWFAGRVWRFDYPGRTLSLLPAETPAAPLGPAPSGGVTVPLGFKEAPPAEAPNYPRLTVVVDGEPLDLLFDTGAYTVLTDSVRQVIGDGRPASRAASFIARSVFDRWHTRHPAWRVVPHAEAGSGQDMIEVPAVAIGGLSAGPVWFTARSDRAFHDFMSQWMDRRVEGALGGSGLRYYRVTVDYPRRRATFDVPPR